MKKHTPKPLLQEIEQSMEHLSERLAMLDEKLFDLQSRYARMRLQTSKAMVSNTPSSCKVTFYSNAMFLNNL